MMAEDPTPGCSNDTDIDTGGYLVPSGSRSAECLTPPNSANKDNSVPPQAPPNPDLGELQTTMDLSATAAAMKARATQHFTFSSEQVDCICDSLEQRGEIKQLEHFLQLWGHEHQNDLSEPSEAVMRAKAYVAFENGNFKDLYHILEQREFDSKYHTQLQDMWYRAHYKEAESVRGRALGKRISIFKGHELRCT